MSSNPALRKLVLRRCGFNIDQLNEAELKKRLPEMVQAVNLESLATCGVVGRQIVEIQKAASLQVHYHRSFIPSQGLERDERLPDSIEYSGDYGDPNSILNDLFPGEIS